jgi:uncharacterized protein (DUF433 family)
MTDGASRDGADRPDNTSINETPGVCGGYPCIGNTRIPVRVVVTAYRNLGSVARVAEAYPQLSAAQVEAALEYYRAHPVRVDEDIETDARAEEETVGRPWPA